MTIFLLILSLKIRYLSFLKSIEFEKAFLHLVEEGFFLLTFKDNIEIEKENALEIVEKMSNWINDNLFVILVDARDIRSGMSHEAREVFSTDERITKFRLAQAIVINSLANRLVANFYITFHKPQGGEVKVFNNYDNAYLWANEMKQP